MGFYAAAVYSAIVRRIIVVRDDPVRRSDATAGGPDFRRRWNPGGYRGGAPPGVQPRVPRIRARLGMERGTLSRVAACLGRQGAHLALHRHTAVDGAGKVATA